MLMTSTSSANTAFVLGIHPMVRAPMGSIPLSSVPGSEQRVCLSCRIDTCGRRLSLRVGLVVLVLIPVPTASALSQTPDPVQFVLTFTHGVSAQRGSTTIDLTERTGRLGALIADFLSMATGATMKSVFC
jgi:hypothetical protein